MVRLKTGGNVIIDELSLGTLNFFGVQMGVIREGKGAETTRPSDTPPMLGGAKPPRSSDFPSMFGGERGTCPNHLIYKSPKLSFDKSFQSIVQSKRHLEWKKFGAVFLLKPRLLRCKLEGVWTQSLDNPDID